MTNREEPGTSTAVQPEPKLRHDPPELPGYRLQVREAIPVRRLNWLAFPLAVPSAALFFGIGALIQGTDQIAISFSFVELLVLLGIVLLGVPILHEAVHGLVAMIAGARPFYGIGNGYAYTSFREPISPRQYAVITAAPLVLLSLVSIPAFALDPNWFFYVLVFATTNAAGAIGDLWILNRIRKLPQDALIYDLADGYAAFVPEPSR